MDNIEFNKILNAYKNNDIETQNLIFLMGNKGVEICQCIVAWKNTRVELNFKADVKRKTDDWEYLWAFCFFDEKQFAGLCEMEQFEARKKFEKLKTLKLIYPDGTANSLADGIINGILKKSFYKSTGIKEK